MNAPVDLGAGCRGAGVALPGRLQPWQRDLLGAPDQLARLLDEHGSPVNLIEPAPLPRHADALVAAGASLGVDVRVFFARKANKALALVDLALAAGHGVDVASERELAQVLAAGAPPERVILTAAVKPRGLLELAVGTGVAISVDNIDELRLLREVADSLAATPTVALRLAGRRPIVSRFGLPAAHWARLADEGALAGLQIEGVHLHLHGYAAADRASGLREALALTEQVTQSGHRLEWIDLGGGIPMRYLDDVGPWQAFWAAHRDGLATGDPLTWEGRGLGLQVWDGQVRGTPAVYPMWQDPVGADWVRDVLRSPLLTADGDSPTLAEELRRRGLRLHLEPGRSLLDGCGLTVARVETRKQRSDGTWLISLAMNRTQCRSAAEDFLLDPILVPTGAGERTPATAGYLVGAYCIEAELLSWRRFEFPHGVAVGDLVAFVNTAGYQMHILESASHQVPLARNLVPDGTGGWQRDRIDTDAGG